MASRLSPLLRRSIVATRSTSSAIRGGSPPLPPFARIPAPTQKLVEQRDVIFDDGVAPELALDFDCQHISSTEALFSWLGALSGFGLLYMLVDYYDPPSMNPAVGREMNMVVEAPKTRLQLLAEAKQKAGGAVAASADDEEEDDEE